MTTMLALEHVGKSYPHATGLVHVLEDANLKVEAGTTLAVLGPSGSGKSTLLALIAGLDRPSRGQVLVAGQDLSHLNERQLAAFRARHLGIVFQQFHLLAHLNAAENVAIPLRLGGHAVPAAAAAASEALAAVGLGHRTGHFPHQLSGGECQRVAIARALIAKPALILADEPSGNLDTRIGDQVMQLLFRLVAAQKSTLVLVTHNESLARQCQRRIELRGGGLVPGFS